MSSGCEAADSKARCPSAALRTSSMLLETQRFSGNLAESTLFCAERKRPCAEAAAEASAGSKLAAGGAFLSPGTAGFCLPNGLC